MLTHRRQRILGDSLGKRSDDLMPMRPAIGGLFR